MEPKVLLSLEDLCIPIGGSREALRRQFSTPPTAYFLLIRLSGSVVALARAV